MPEKMSETPKQYTIQARLVSDTGEQTGDPLDLPITVTTNQLELICNALLKNVSDFIHFPLQELLTYFAHSRMNKHLICSLSTTKKSRRA